MSGRPLITPLSVEDDGSDRPSDPYGEINYLSDYENMDTKSMRARYNSYPRVTVTIGICMGMVGFQWMLQQLEEETEENESGGGLCYANKECSYRKDVLGAWSVPGHNSNHVLSNLVYVVVGLMISVYACSSKESDAQVGHGQARGFFSARYRGMYINGGISLIVEGGLSGLYHICPTPWNNQFDYVGITLLCLSLFLMLWSRRHPPIISVGTWASFFGCIFTLCSLAALDAKHDRPAVRALVWGLCLLFYLLLMPRLFLMLHYGLPFFVPEPSEGCGLRACWNALTRMSTFRFFLVMWLLGLAYFSYCCSKGVMLTPTIMKYSCGFLAAYMLYYIANEYLEQRARWRGYDEVGADDPGAADAGSRAVCSRDETVQWAKVLVTATSAVLFMSAGLYFFTHDVYNPTISMAKSEELNQPCELMGYFDNHDIWHLCSGIALGCVIEVSMMLDGFYTNRDRCEMRVF